MSRQVRRVRAPSEHGHRAGEVAVKHGRNTFLSTLGAGLVCGIVAVLIGPTAVYAQAGKTFVMKLSTATINDTQHEWLKRFAAAVEKDSGGRIKGEIYPASQLGSIPRQVEGVQFGSIQAWIGPPEFLTGIDDRFEVLSAPGLFTSRPQAEKVIHDPVVTKLMFGLGANKGLIGLGIAPIGPSSIITRKPVRHLAEFKGLKIRVLASPFQLELIKRMEGSPIAMTLADVVPGLQQGTIDGSLSTVTVYTTMKFHDVAKYVTETDQPYIVSIVELSKKWYDTLPPDLQKIVMDDGKKVSDEIDTFVDEFFDNQRKIWTQGGGEFISLPNAEQSEMIAKINTIAEDLAKSKPSLNEAIKVVEESAKRNK
jgi:TRAP-type C4-dicarboxylate transport system substrate-binding protein